MSILASLLSALVGLIVCIGAVAAIIWVPLLLFSFTVKKVVK